MLFSATFNFDVLNLADQWTIDALRVEIEPEKVAADAVDQKVYLATTEEKFTILLNLLKDESKVSSVIVFVNRRDTTREIFERLRAKGVSCGILSGDVPQHKRVKTLERFKDGSIKVLVATDVAGRGIHIDGISHVVNFTLPEDPEDYVHRIGRTGRAGATGQSVSFACEEDGFLLPEIEKLLGMKLECERPPEDLLIEG
jgi:ATP-dependent RNA helicase RhlB